MRRGVLTGAALAASLFVAPHALACAPLLATDRETGESWTSGSPEWLRREQAGWRAEADLIFIAQIREARMVAGGEIDFTLVPIVTVDGHPPPDDAMLVYRWHPRHTCNAFELNLTDLVVVYADLEEPFGWSVVGLTVPDRLQDRPPDFGRRVREVHRGMIPGPALPD
jgi:hypothetical protein